MVSRTYYEKNKGYWKLYHKKHRIKINRYQRKWAIMNPDKIKKYRKKNKKSLRIGSNKHKKRLWKNHPKKMRKRSTLYDIRIKLKVFNHYSKGKMDCSCCGERYIEFLTIDHVHGNGASELRNLKLKGGRHFYSWLIKNNFPRGYRILCMNCNYSRGRHGFCPHKNKKKHTYLLFDIKRSKLPLGTVVYHRLK